LSRRYADLSIPAAEDATRNLLVLRYNRVRTGQNGAYQSWVKDKLRPALIKGGATGVNFSKVTYGANTGTWISTSSAENWAALDGRGPLGGLSDEEIAALFAGFSDIVAGTEVRILRYREDLSY
jgi:hypothetical protein